LPLDLFRNRVIAVSCVGSIVVGALLFTLTAFVPMFAQGVLGGTASDAGAPLVAMSVGWPLASALAGRFMIRVGYRPLVVMGGTFTVLGVSMLAFIGPGTSMLFLIVAMVILGVGNGFVSTPYLVAVQNAVPWNRRGIATSLGQFFRTIGGSIAVAGFGAVLNARLAQHIGQGINANATLDPALRGSLSPEQLQGLTAGLGAGLHAVFVACTALSVLGLFVTLLFPGGSAAEHVHKEVVA
jgi:MFS family permease